MKQLLVILFLGLFFLISCTNNSSQDGAYKMAAEPAPLSYSGEKDLSTSAVRSTDSPTPKSAVVERKRILNAQLEMRVDDVYAAERELINRTRKLGGWIISSSLFWDEVTLVVKIPADKYELFLSDSETLGEIESKSESSDDVTEYYYDLENRIKNKKLLQARFRAYLEKADSMEDILAVERQLSDVTTEIERLEGTFRGLNRDIDYSTVSFQLLPPLTETVSGRIPSFYKTFATLGYKVLSFLYYLLFGVIYLLIFGIPIVLVLGLIYILGWGRIGLIRRFFKKLKN